MFLLRPIPVLNRISDMLNPCIVVLGMRTNGDGLDSDALFEMSVCRIIGILSLKDFFSAESIHECSSTYGRRSIVVRGRV